MFSFFLLFYFIIIVYYSLLRHKAATLNMQTVKFTMQNSQYVYERFSNKYTLLQVGPRYQSVPQSERTNRHDRTGLAGHEH